MKRRYLSVLLAMCIMVMAFSACTPAETQETSSNPISSKEEVQSQESKEEPVDEAPMKVKWFFSRQIPTGKSEVTKALEELLNVDFELLGVEDAQYVEKLNLFMASNDMPDVFRTWTQDPTFLKGGCATLTRELIKTNMPKYYETVNSKGIEVYGDENTVWERFSVDGKLPQIPEIAFANQFVSGTLFRTDILSELGVEIPTTIEEYENVFKLYKAKYPNNYPYGGGTGKLMFQSFSTIFNAYGTDAAQWVIRDGKMVPGWLVPEAREALIKLAQWQKAGYINPEWPLFNAENLNNDFISGKYLLRIWVGFREGSMVTEEPYFPGSLVEKTASQNPGATFGLGPVPVSREGMKPPSMCWDPFYGMGLGFGIHNESDPKRLEKLMQMIERMYYDEQAVLLHYFGIQGKHWELNADGFPERLSGFVTPEEQTAINVGTYWHIGGSSPVLWKYQYSPKILASLDKYMRTPGAIYSTDKVEYSRDKVKGPLKSESGEDLGTKYSNLYDERDIVITEIITGESGIERFDAMVENWNKNGGKELEEAANRLYMKYWK